MNEELQNLLYGKIINSHEFNRILKLSEKYTDLSESDYYEAMEAREQACEALDEASNAISQYGRLTLFKKLTKEGRQLRLKKNKFDECKKTCEEKATYFYRIAESYRINDVLEKCKSSYFPNYLRKFFRSRGLNYSGFNFHFNCFNDNVVVADEFKEELKEKLKVIRPGEGIVIQEGQLAHEDKDGIICIMSEEMLRRARVAGQDTFFINTAIEPDKVIPKKSGNTSVYKKVF